MCVTAHVHIPVHPPVALAPPVQQLNALHRQLTCTHPEISLMTHTGDDSDWGNMCHNYPTKGY